MQRYRSGHNEAVLKTVWVHARVGSNPTLCAKKEATLVASFFIQAAGLVYHHTLVCISSPQAYIITEGAFSCGLMRYNTLC